MIQVKMCCGLECTARGGQELILAIEEDPVLRAGVVIEYGRCTGLCKDGEFSPVVRIGGEEFLSMTAERLVDLLHTKLGTSGEEEVD